MEKIKGRIWIPYRVAFEYHRRLNDIISEQVSAYEEAIKTLNSFNAKFKEKRKHPFLDSSLHKEVEDFTNKFEQALNDKKNVIRELILNNPIKERLANIIESAVGKPFSSNELEEIFEEGKKRYDDKIPPGYKDRGSKPGNEIYGDLIIWKEICEKVKLTDKPLLFVTGDVKEDWFQTTMGLTIGPRPELIEEIKKHKDILFYMYPIDTFLRRAKNDLNIDLNEGTLSEVEEIINESRKIQEKLNAQEDSFSSESFELNSSEFFNNQAQNSEEDFGQVNGESETET